MQPCRFVRLRGERSCADSARGTCPSGLPSIACGRDEGSRSGAYCRAVLSACAASGLAQTAPEGLVPLDSHPSPAGGTEEAAPAHTAVLFRSPARRAVLRRQRQRDLSLWTPIHRLRAGRRKPLRRVSLHMRIEGKTVLPFFKKHCRFCRRSNST